MKNIFLDTNILLDFFANRKPFSWEAAMLLNYSYCRKVKIYISAVSYNNVYYILRQSFSHIQTIKMLAELNEWTDILDVSKEVIRKAIKSDFKDFEDAIQYNCAKSLGKIDFIVTRDSKDYKSSSLPVFSPKEALVLIQEQEG